MYTAFKIEAQRNRSSDQFGERDGVENDRGVCSSRKDPGLWTATVSFPVFLLPSSWQDTNILDAKLSLVFHSMQMVERYSWLLLSCWLK